MNDLKQVALGVVGAAIFALFVYILDLVTKGGLILFLSGITREEFQEFKEQSEEAHSELSLRTASVEKIGEQIEEARNELGRAIVSVEEQVAALEARVENYHPAISTSGPTLSAPFVVADEYVPSGFMGDPPPIGDEPYLRIDPVFTGCERPGDGDDACIRIQYDSVGTMWAGIYWQFPEGNWGVEPGKTIVNASRIRFFARGDTGRERAKFVAGGIRGQQFEDSFEARHGSVRLTDQWQSYEIDLTGEDLSSVIGAFAWVSEAGGNPDTVIIYLDDIRYLE